MPITAAYWFNHEDVMDLLRSAFYYFLIVFGAGFILGTIRVPLLVPQLGVRTAELIEMPLMLAVIVWAARGRVRAAPALSRRQWLGVGVVALALLAGAELLAARWLAGQSPRAYVLARDPVSGSVYLGCLMVFALAPFFWRGQKTN